MGFTVNSFLRSRSFISSKEDRMRFRIFRGLYYVNRLVRRNAGSLYYIYLLTVLVEAAGVAVGLYSTRYITNLITAVAMGEPPQYRVLLLLLVATGIIYVTATIRKIILEHIRLKIRFAFDRSLCENVSVLKWEYFEDYATSNKINSINEKSYDCIMRMFEHTYHYLLYILSSIVFSYFLLLFHWMIMVLYLGILIVSIYFSDKVFASNYTIWDAVLPLKKQQKYFVSVATDVNTHQEYQSNRLFSFLSRKWEALDHVIYGQEMRIYRRYEIVMQISRLIMNLPYFAMIVVTCYHVIHGRFDVGFLVMSFNLFNQVVNLFGQIESDLHQDQEDAGFVLDYFDMLSWEKEDDTRHAGISESIQFKQVSYRYPQSERYAVKAIDMTAGFHEKIAIVGKNGSGKTTFALLLSSLIDKIENGQILIDGQEMERVPVARHDIACLFQDFEQYHMTIQENIKIGRKDCKITEEEIYALLQKVGLEEYVSTLPKGIDTLLGQLEDGGVWLSKGQWQRLAIARLMANEDARIWILDEPTASLDPLSEIEVYNLIMNVAQDKMVFFISHRLGFAKQVNRILLFCDGKIIGDSTHDSLLEEEHYREMFKSQESWYA